MTNVFENFKNEYIPSLKQEMLSLNNFSTTNVDVARVVNQRIKEIAIELEFWDKQKF